MSTKPVEKPRIYLPLPDEIQGAFAHGQWVLDSPGMVINFNCDVLENGYPFIEPWVEKLEEFRNSDAATMEFEAPHLPGVHHLTREVLPHILFTSPAWSKKVMARSSGNGTQLLDANSKLPIVRKFPQRN